MTEIMGELLEDAPDKFEKLVFKRELQHGDMPYIALMYPIAIYRYDDMDDENPPDFSPPHFYIAATDDRLLVSLNEETLKRTLDRQGEATTAWLGSSLGLKLDRRALGVLDLFIQPMFDKSSERGIARNAELFAWYKERFPTQDPVQLHQRLFGERLLLPEEMPRQSSLTDIKSVEFGITLENNGIRARGEVRW